MRPRRDTAAAPTRRKRGPAGPVAWCWVLAGACVLTAPAALLALATGASASPASPVAAAVAAVQAEIPHAAPAETPPPTIDERPFDDPFTRGYYLIHLLGTNTTGGFVPKDTYILNPEPPVDGWFLTPDGEGGTFNNKGDQVAGPLTTPRAVCQAAAGLPVQTWSVEGRDFNCALLPSSGGGGVPGGILGWVAGAVVLGAAGAGAAYVATHRPKPPTPQQPATNPCAELNAVGNEYRAMLDEFERRKDEIRRQIEGFQAEQLRLQGIHNNLANLQSTMSWMRGSMVVSNVAYHVVWIASLVAGEFKLLSIALGGVGPMRDLLVEALDIPSRTWTDPLATDLRADLDAKYAQLAVEYERQARAFNERQREWWRPHEQAMQGLSDRYTDVWRRLRAAYAACHPGAWDPFKGMSDKAPYQQYGVPDVETFLVPERAP